MGSSATPDLSQGGEINGDITITGDLKVEGGGSFSFDEIVEGTQVIEKTGTEAFLVRKDSDGGDVFVVDTTNTRVGIGITSPTAPLHIYQNNSVTDATGGLLIENDGTGDAVIQFLLTGTKRWMAGIDNSDSDKFKIVHGVGDLTNANVFTIDTSSNVEIESSATTGHTLSMKGTSGNSSVRLKLDFNGNDGSQGSKGYLQFNNSTNSIELQSASGKSLRFQTGGATDRMILDDNSKISLAEE